MIHSAVVPFACHLQSPEPVFVKNMLLRGCVLRNTSCVYGLVLNTGVDTKITRNASGTPSKKSSR